MPYSHIHCPMNARLLLVDDDPISLMVLNKAIEETHEVRFATAGVQAFELLREAPADLILLDMNMPEMDGFEVCRRLKNDPITADIPVIFVTAQQDTEAETNALDAGGVDFIVKPINPAVVRARIRTHLTLKAQSDFLKKIAFIDGLTGIANRRRYDDALLTEWRYCRRNNLPLTLLMIDIDHFKQFNDHYGHLEGDNCLKTVATAIKQPFFRSHDIVARYGGEEFICLLPACDREPGRTKAEDVRRTIADLEIPHATSSTARVVTVSIGVASVYPNDVGNPLALFRAADTALYQAKNSGRNQVCVAAETA